MFPRVYSLETKWKQREWNEEGRTLICSIETLVYVAKTFSVVERFARVQNKFQQCATNEYTQEFQGTHYNPVKYPKVMGTPFPILQTPYAVDFFINIT